MIAVAVLCWPLEQPNTPKAVTPPHGSVIRLEMPGLGEGVFGTAVLVDRQRQPAGVTLYYLTAERLFAQVLGKAHADTVDASGIGVLRIFADASDAPPQPMQFEAPLEGDVFVIAGVDHADHLVTMEQRISSVSARAATGDRGLPDLVGCIGAPAIRDGQVFGIVMECDAIHPPVIELLGVARDFLAGKIPSLRGEPGSLSTTGEETAPPSMVLRDN